MQVRILAKFNTDEKVAILCFLKDIPIIQARLSKVYGGNWLLVDGLQVDEVLKFRDGWQYKSLAPLKGKTRYCSKIEKLNI